MQGFTAQSGTLTSTCAQMAVSRSRVCSPAADLSQPSSFSAWNYTGPFFIMCIDPPGARGVRGTGAANTRWTQLYISEPQIRKPCCITQLVNY